MAEHSPSPAPTRTRKRRLPVRWLTLGEIVGVAAVVIAGLGYWDSHRERTREDQEHATAERERASEARRAAAQTLFLMTGSVDGSGERISLAPAHPDQIVQTQTFIFPRAVRDTAVTTTGLTRIEADWFADGLKKKANRPREADAGSERMPLGVVTQYIVDGETHTDRAIYQVGYNVHGRLLRGAKLELEGLSPATRHVPGDLQAAVDALWARQHPPPQTQ